MSDPLDLSGLVPSDTAVIDILAPGSMTPTGWKIELAGPAHPKTQAITDQLARKRLEKEKAIELAQVNGRKYKGDAETAQSRALENVGRIAARILGWSPNPLFRNVSPEPIAFSEQAAVDLLMRDDMGWLLAQIADYLASEQAFTKGSAKT